jgi:RNA polymerase sigma-70 factor (ECF subfamily)
MALNPIDLRSSSARRASGAGRRLRPRACGRETGYSQPLPMLYLRPPGVAEKTLQFYEFDAGYLESLRAGDFRTQEHFVGYFTELLHLKLRSRIKSSQSIEDVRQETFARVLTALRKKDTLQQPERLGAFVNSVCNNVLFEHYRSSSRSESLDDADRPEIPATGADALSLVVDSQLKAKIREILLDMPVRDRSLLQAVFLDERDRDEVCREFGVDREYLRVLLFRAKQDFKTAYLKRMGTGHGSAKP